MIVVSLGNAQAISVGKSGTPEKLAGERTTTVCIPEDWSLDAALAAVAASWSQHSQPGFSPVWVECTDSGLLEAIAEKYDLSPEQLVRPADWGTPVANRLAPEMAEQAAPLIIEVGAAQVAADAIGRV